MQAHISQAVLIVIRHEAVVNQTYVDCYLLKYYYDFQSKTYIYPLSKEKKNLKTIFIKFVYPVQIYFYFQQVEFIPFLVATPLGNTQNLRFEK